MRTLCLIGCSKKKADHRMPVRDLYTSQLFRLSRAWAERNAEHWAVLSAYHGVCEPDMELNPYDFTPADRMCFGWPTQVAQPEYDYYLGDDVERWMRRWGPGRLVILAGSSYVGCVRRHNPSLVIEDPLQGLQIGQRLQWLTRSIQRSMLGVD